MSHLPNEIWLHILSHTLTDEEEETLTTAQTLWLSLRPTSSQLKACVEKHFSTSHLRHFKLLLPITLPSYDQRNPLQGHAIFVPEIRGRDVLWFVFERTEPEYFITQFLTRWGGMTVPSAGLVKGMVCWDVEFGGRRVRTRFRDAMVAGDGEEVMVGMRWMAMMTVFFKT